MYVFLFYTLLFLIKNRNYTTLIRATSSLASSRFTCVYVFSVTLICENVYYTFFVIHIRFLHLYFNSLFAFFKMLFYPLHCLQSIKMTLWSKRLILWKLACLILNSKIIQIRFILILYGQTGICQIAFFVVPFL